MFVSSHSLTTPVRYWYVPLLAGIALLVLGITLVLMPAVSYSVLATLFSCALLVSGAFDVAFACGNYKQLEHWGAYLLLGISYMVLGGALLLNPDMSVLALSFYVGLVILLRAVVVTGVALQLRQYHLPYWRTLLVFGVVGIAYALAMLVFPAFASMSIIVLTSLACIQLGCLNILLALKLKHFKELPKKVSAELKKKLENVQHEVQVFFQRR